MNKTKADQYVRQRADDLRSLARVLLDAGIIRDTEPLQRAAAACKLLRAEEGYRWEYRMHGLQFRTLDLVSGELRHSRPRTLSYLDLQLDVVLEGACLDDNALVDPLSNLIVDLQIEGLDERGEALSCAWHLDRHISAEASQNSATPEGEGQSEFAHPHYHFQFGGRQVWSKADVEFGTHMLLEPPRIAHPPLDAILAADFVISNYYGRFWRELRRDSGTYNELLRESQTRLWRPYAIATARYWDRAPRPDWYAPPIWPQLFQFE